MKLGTEWSRLNGICPVNAQGANPCFWVFGECFEYFASFAVNKRICLIIRLLAKVTGFFDFGCEFFDSGYYAVLFGKGWERNLDLKKSVGLKPNTICSSFA